MRSQHQTTKVPACRRHMRFGRFLLLVLTLTILWVPVEARSHLIVDLHPISSDPGRVELAVQTAWPDWRSSRLPTWLGEFVHFDLQYPLTLLPLRTGRYRLEHLDIYADGSAESHTVYLGKRFDLHFKADVVYYFGFRSLMAEELSDDELETITNRVCRAYPEAVTSDQLMLLLHDLKTVLVEEPCGRPPTPPASE